MPKYLVYPDDYDPAVADGPPTEDYVKLGISWTKEQTEYARSLEEKAVIIEAEKQPLGKWCLEIKEDMGNTNGRD